MKLVSLVAVAALCAACSNGGPAENVAAGSDASGTQPAVAEAANVKAEYKEVTIPAGTTLRLQLKSAIGSDISKVEDTVTAELRQGVTVNGQTVIPAGADVVGNVTDVERSGRVKGRAHISYRFTSLRTAGERYDIRTSSLGATARATKGEDAKKIGIGAGAGAAIGALLGGGSGAAKGAAIGGAGGTGVVLATRGKEVHLGPGADVNTKLTAPVTVRVKL